MRSPAMPFSCRPGVRRSTGTGPTASGATISLVLLGTCSRKTPVPATAERARTRRRPTSSRGRKTKAPRSRSTPLFVLLAADVAALVVVGLVMVLSASSVQALRTFGSSWVVFQRQAMWMAIGAVALGVALRTDYRRWRRPSVPLLLLSLALLVVVLIPGLGRALPTGPPLLVPAPVEGRRQHRLPDRPVAGRPGQRALDGPGPGRQPGQVGLPSQRLHRLHLRRHRRGAGPARDAARHRPLRRLRRPRCAGRHPRARPLRRPAGGRDHGLGGRTGADQHRRRHRRAP